MLETLHSVRKQGFAASSVDAAVNTTEFALRENNTGRFPKGLALMFRAMNAWVYDRDPYECASVLTSSRVLGLFSCTCTGVVCALRSCSAP